MAIRTAVEWENSEFFVNSGSPSVLGRLKNVIREQTFLAHESIFNEGDSASDVYILKSGQVELTYTLPTHHETALRITLVRPGELFAWSGLTGGPSLTARARPLEDSEAFVIPADELRKIMDAYPDFGYLVMNRLATLIARRLADTRTQLQWLNSSI